MKDANRKKIEEIMAGMKCPKDFICAETDFKQLCRSNDMGINGFLECLEEKPWECPFSLPFGNSHFCECPLRIYLCKKLNI